MNLRLMPQKLKLSAHLILTSL